LAAATLLAAQKSQDFVTNDLDDLLDYFEIGRLLRRKALDMDRYGDGVERLLRVDTYLLARFAALVRTCRAESGDQTRRLDFERLCSSAFILA
jgi:hypothetical protein